MSTKDDKPDAELKEALGNLQEAVELFCVAYSEARAATRTECPMV